MSTQTALITGASRGLGLALARELAQQNWRLIINAKGADALETVADKTGHVSRDEGWTSLIISPDHPMQIVDGLLTGMHEPSATHLSMLQALAGLDHLKLTYEAALNKHYLWHEFGDLHLILP